MVERLETHQGRTLQEHISATSCQESGPLHKPARKDEEHGGQPAPFALVDQHEPFAQVARHAPFGQSDCSMGTGREASSHAEVRASGPHAGAAHRGSAPGFARWGSHAGGVVCTCPRARAVRIEDMRAGAAHAEGRVPRGGPRAEARLPVGSTRRIARAQKSAAPKNGAFPANYGRKPDPP